MIVRVLAGTAVAAAVLASTATSATRPASHSPSLRGGALVAKVVVPSLVRRAPSDATTVYAARTQTAWSRGPTWLLVLGRSVDPDGIEWLRVELPIRPNGRDGWIRADHVILESDPWWIEVSTARRLVSVFRNGRLVRRFRAVVGAPATPTPHGLFALHDPIRQPGANGFLGTWALHLSALSNALEDYGGGPGRIALHGRGGASLRDPLGTAASHGCIRLDNVAVDWLARTIPRGTPVRIRE